ncbi:MAG: hypothetical protein OXE57_00650 [Alphaproteobacteria bacterium]|nr:hypothetical protein [Alphaproteobacteria bacterium]
MSARFDTLAAAEALENVGFDRDKARVMATQLQVASDAGQPVTRPKLEAALGALKAELLERIAGTGKRMIQHRADMERRLMDRTASLIWRLIGAMVALAGVIIAAVKLIP